MKKILFIHIPKTAGTSLSEWIKRHYNFNEVMYTPTWEKFQYSTIRDLRSKRFIQGHFTANIIDYIPDSKNFHKITLLRNPIDRVISNFYHLKLTPDIPHDHPVKAKSFTIYDFLEHPVTNYLASNYQTLSLTKRNKINPAEFDMLINAPFSYYNKIKKQIHTIDKAVDFINSFSVIGVYEKLDLFVKMLSKELGFFDQIISGEYRATIKSKIIPEDAIKKIEEKNQLDIELYNYVLKKIENFTEKKIASYKKSTNPISVKDNDSFIWTANMAFWGNFWTDVNLSDNQNYHRWSYTNTSNFIIEVEKNTVVTLIFTIERFLDPSQIDGFCISCNGKNLDLKRLILPSGNKINFLTTVYTGELEELNIKFDTEKTLSFANVDSNNPNDTLKRGFSINQISIYKYRLPSN